MKPADPRLPVKRTRHHDRSVVRVFLAVFVPVAVVLFAFHGYIYFNKRDFIYHSLLKAERHEVSMLSESLEEYFEWMINDLNFIAAVCDDSSYVKTCSPAGCENLTQTLLTFSRESGIYDQIRLIGTDGVERIRINYNDGEPEVVASGELQNKRDRYYFQQISKLSAGRVYLSPLDLNVEHGRVEEPPKPTLRLGTSLLDGDGRPAGVVMLNYLGTHLLQHVRVQHALGATSPDRGEVSLLNPEGYWLLAPDAADEWGFMRKGGEKNTFAVRYPEAWQAIAAEESGSVRTANGLFTYVTVRPRGRGLAVGDDYYWKLISRLPLDRAEGPFVHEQLLFLFIGGLLLLLAVGLAAGTVSVFQRKKLYEEELLKLATTDPLTGLLNRRAFLDRLVNEKNRYDRYGGSLVLLMGDIDHFKEVNDRYGHDAGDYVLRRVSKIFQTRMRVTDVLCRWGGEEFMLLLAGDREMDGVFVAEKVRAMVEAELFSFDGRDIPVTISFGVVCYQKGMAVEHCIQLADQSLYYSKKNGRNQVTVADEGVSMPAGEVKG